MINFNGMLLSKEKEILYYNNRGLKYGDAVFETLRCLKGALIFREDHYFRLMASMRMLRMEIPMDFTLEFLEEQIKRTIKKNGLEDHPARVRLTVFRKEGGLYTPGTHDVSYLIEVSSLSYPFYLIDNQDYEVELFKDYYVNKDRLSNLKTTNRILNVVAGVYTKENGYANCLLINTDKQVVEALNGNLFLVKGHTIKTPPLSDGCLNGILRKKIMEIVVVSEEFQLEEASISPFELQKADELFITNSIQGIRPVTKYRKKEFASTLSKKLLGRLNAKVKMDLLS